MKSTTEQVNKQVATAKGSSVNTDIVICEQPLQITLVFSGELADGVIDSLSENFANTFIYTLTMRTPGDEQAHITGLLLSDGVITDKNQIISMIIDEDDNTQENLWNVTLAESCRANIKAINKYQTTYSSCGLCGNTSLKALELKDISPLADTASWLNKQTILDAGQLLFNAQPLQSVTGGAHCAALFESQGVLVAIKEDIGRHNALDKLIGHLALTDVLISESNYFAIISSRVSFEMVQKTLVAGIPVLVALGAPSALAIQAAKRFNLTLIAFLKAETFNVYHGEWRLKH